MKKYLLFIAFAALTSTMFAQTTAQVSTANKTEMHSRNSATREAKDQAPANKKYHKHKKLAKKHHHHKKARKMARKSSATK